MSPVFDAYNNSPHSTTKIAPDKVYKENEIQVLMNINKSAKKGTYPTLEGGNNVRVPVIHKQKKGYKIVSVWKYTKLKTKIEDYTLLMGHYIPEKIYNL